MARVLEFPKAKTIDEWLGEVKTEMSTAKKVAIVFEMDDGYVMTGYYHCNFTDKAVLSEHIRFDAIHESMVATFELTKREDV
jgi:hypothetical protein